MSELLKIVSSQYKHLYARDTDFIDGRILRNASILKNEPFSFQALYRAEGGFKGHRVSVWVDCDLPVSAWRVDYVPIVNTTASAGGKEYESSEPGLYPDVLIPRPTKPEICATGTAKNFYYEKDTDATLNAASEKFQSVWFTVNNESKTLKAGQYTIRVVMTSLVSGEVLAEESITLKVIDKVLPKEDFYYTNWFHVDCLCDMFGVKPYSNAFYKIFDRFIKNMTLHRQNTLLLPAFTPPLDTEIGEERMNVQLVEIENVGSSWCFDFEKMRRFVRHAKKCGIKIFEHCHLFSQWGAKAAPNIYDKAGKRIFGYDTDAKSKEYAEFIRAYLDAFLSFAKEEKIENKLIFHISDEPTAKQMEDYRAAHDTVCDLLRNAPISDAMYDCSFYEAGLVDQPILSVKCTEGYDEKKCPSIWLYYTGGEEDTANRKISNTAAATRAIGLHMYKYKALGFLHWAYNFYYDVSSIGLFDPKLSPNAYRRLPGVTFLCYPTCTRGVGTAIPSIRELLMREAMDDLRALKLLESKIGREATLRICEEKLGEITTYTIPVGEELRELREIINEKLS